MSEIFGNYPENLEADLEAANSAKIKHVDTKKLIKRVDKLCKETRKQRKMLQKIYQQGKKKIISAEEAVNTQEESTDENAESSKNKTDDGAKDSQKKEKSFFNKMGEAFLKALPSIFRTIASVAVTAVFGFVSKRFGLRRRASYAI